MKFGVKPASSLFHKHEINSNPLLLFARRHHSLGKRLLVLIISAKTKDIEIGLSNYFDLYGVENLLSQSKQLRQACKINK